MIQVVVLLQVWAYLYSSIKPCATNSVPEKIQHLLGDSQTLSVWFYHHGDYSSLVSRYLRFLHSSHTLQVSTMALYTRTLEFKFFQFALSIVDDAQVNSSPLGPTFHSLALGSSDGVIKHWEQMNFDGKQAPRDESGYKFFVEKVFELLRRISEDQNEGYMRVNEAFRLADMVKEGPQLRHDQHSQHAESMNWTHIDVLWMWKHQVQLLQDTIKNQQQEPQGSGQRGL